MLSLCNGQVSRALLALFSAGLERIRARETTAIQAGYSQKHEEVWVGLRFHARPWCSNSLGTS